MTINQLRCKLRSVVKPIFTDDFGKKYSMIAAQHTPEMIDQISDGYKNEIDAYILLAEHLEESPEMLRLLALTVNPLVAFGVFVRYHYLTQLFISMDQKAQCDFVSDENTLLSSVLIHKWEDVLRQYQHKPSKGFQFP